MFKISGLIFLLFTSLSLGQSQTNLTQKERANVISELLKKSDSIYLNEGDINIEQDLLLQADRLTKKLTIDPDTLAIKVKKNLGFIYMDTDQNDKAISYFKEVLELAQNKKLQDETIRALMYIGQGHGKKLEFDKAIPFLEKSLALLEQVGSKTLPGVEANILINLGIIHLDMDEIEDAINFFKNALVLAKEEKDFENELVIYNNLSICYSNIKQFRKAIQFIKKAITVNDDHNLGRFSEPYDNLGCNYTDLKQYDSAQYYFEIGRDIALEAKDKNALCWITADMGWMYCEQKKYKKGIPFLIEGYTLADSLNIIEVALESSINLSEAYEKLNDYPNALVYLEKSIPHKKKIDANITERKFEEFNVKYKTLEKEDKIVFLNKENQLSEIIISQKQKQKKILVIVFLGCIILLSLGTWVWQKINKNRLLEKQKTLRFKSVIETEQKERKRIAQDLYNSIGKSITELKKQAKSIKPIAESEKTKYKKLLIQVDQVYDELRDVSHNIMPNTLITLGFVPAVEELISDINTDTSLKIQLKKHAGFKHLNEDQSINLYRIIQEALVNIIKHAKASLVNIDLLYKNGIHSINIKDNGVGMDASIIENLKGIGWKNIFSRVALLSGHIDVSSKPNKGTTITISINNSTNS